MYNLLNRKIYFILIFKNIYSEISSKDQEEYKAEDSTESIANKLCENLINKGDQKELIEYCQENKIICIDEDNYESSINKKWEYLENILYERYKYQNDSVLKENKNIKVQIPLITQEEHLLAYQLVAKLNSNNDSGGLFKNKIKCFIL